MTSTTPGNPGDLAAHAFRRSHLGRRPGDPLVLPNVWDAVSARAFAAAGFTALATSSSAVAATLGYEDGGDTPADEAFAALRRIAAAVEVPVTADIEDGYGLAPEEVVDRLLAAGAVGCNLEDTGPGGLVREPKEQAESLRRFVAAAAGRLVLNARVDTFLYGDRTLGTAIERAVRYAEAGADCVYPILMPADLLPRFAAEVPVPVNMLALPGGPSPAGLGELGASRVTFGGGLHARNSGWIEALAREVRENSAAAEIPLS